MDSGIEMGRADFMIIPRVKRLIVELGQLASSPDSRQVLTQVIFSDSFTST